MDILEQLKTLVDPEQVRILLYLVMANVATGTIGALLKGNFELVKFINFWRRALLVGVAYVSASLLSMAMTDMTEFRTLAWAALIAYLVAHIIANLKDWGLPIPDRFINLIEKP